MRVGGGVGAPAVSVIVPLYNAERYINETLLSLISQSLIDFEVIVVDDGSTDQSAEIVDSFVELDARFSRIQGPAIGSAGAARNEGLRHARGEYVAFLDADDLFAPSMLEKMLSRGRDDDADVVMTGFVTVDDRTGEQRSQPWALRDSFLPAPPFHPSQVADHLFYATNPANWNKIFRRDFVARHGLQFQESRRANDAYFSYIALAMAERVSYVAEELVMYRVETGSSLQSTIHETPLEFIEALLAIEKALRSAGLFSRHERAFLNLVVTMSLGALTRAKWADTFEATYSALRDTVFPRFEVGVARLDDLFTHDSRERVAEIIVRPVNQWLFDRLSAVTSIRRLPESSDRTDVTVAAPFIECLEDASGSHKSHEKRPDVSVIVPVYNASPWLHECLLSVLSQSGTSLEVICVDDGSTDDSLRILHEYATSDARVIIISQPNGGLSVARNTGLQAARGRYTCFLDSDDYWRVDELSELVARADRDSLDVLLFDARSFFEPGVSESTFNSYATYYSRKQEYGEVSSGAELIARMRDGDEYRASACLYLMRTDHVRESKLQFIPGIAHEDNPFTFELLLASSRAAHVRRQVYARRVRPGSIMTAGATERSMRGYFASYLDMQRTLAKYPVPTAIADSVGELVHRLFATCRRLFLSLPVDVADRVREADSSPEGHALFLILNHERNLEKKIRRLEASK